MARYYFAAALNLFPEMKKLKQVLEGSIPGAVVDSRWLDRLAGNSFDVPSLTLLNTDPGKYWTLAGSLDAEDVAGADVVVFFTSEPSTSGGRHVEFGLALGLNKRIVLIGQRENVFQCHPKVEMFDSFEEFLAKEVTWLGTY